MKQLNYQRPIVLLTALSAESKVVLEILPHEILVKEKRLKLYKLTNTICYLMEIGKGFSCSVNRAGTELSKINPVFLINYGFCGALNPVILPYNFYSVNRIFSISNKSVAINNNLTSPFIDILKKYKSKTLLTVDKPVLSEVIRQKYFEDKKCDLVDMEAFKIAQLAKRLSLSLLVFKLVSDNANEETQRDFKTQLPRLIKEMRQNIVSLLENFIF